MSLPECPPFSPRIFMETGTISCGASSEENGIFIWTFAPPQQLATNTPSSSESRLISLLPFSTEASKFIAPPIPTSSSVVNKHSRGGCSISSASIRASPMATAIPLSAPSVVPSALSQSPSTTSFIPSVLKSCSVFLSFSQTISRCP